MLVNGPVKSNSYRQRITVRSATECCLFVMQHDVNVSINVLLNIPFITSANISIIIISIVQSINQYRKSLHRDVASTVQIITVHKIHNSKQLLR